MGADTRRGRGAGIAGLNVTRSGTSIAVRVVAVVAIFTKQRFISAVAATVVAGGRPRAGADPAGFLVAIRSTTITIRCITVVAGLQGIQ
jgi:hypothetical protein